MTDRELIADALRDYAMRRRRIANVSVACAPEYRTEALRAEQIADELDPIRTPFEDMPKPGFLACETCGNQFQRRANVGPIPRFCTPACCKAAGRTRLTARTA